MHYEVVNCTRRARSWVLPHWLQTPNQFSMTRHILLSLCFLPHPLSITNKSKYFILSIKLTVWSYIGNRVLYAHICRASQGYKRVWQGVGWISKVLNQYFYETFLTYWWDVRLQTPSHMLSHRRCIPLTKNQKPWKTLEKAKKADFLQVFDF